MCVCMHVHVRMYVQYVCTYISIHFIALDVYNCVGCTKGVAYKLCFLETDGGMIPV